MKKVKILVVILIGMMFYQNVTMAETIKSGNIFYSPGSYLAGQPLTLGVDPYGYNYQAMKFSGNYYNAYANSAGFPPYNGDDVTYLAENPTAENHWAWPYRNDSLAMKWNEAWLSNQDDDGDGKLDRPTDDGGTYIGSGAWLTNHQSGNYTDEGGDQIWNNFIKIVAVPSTAQAVDAIWYEENGKEIGPVIWGQFAIIQEIINDSGTGEHGISYLSPAGPGVGKW